MLRRYRVRWSGWAGSPGVSTFYCNDPSTNLSKIRVFFDSMKANIPDNIVWSFDSTGDVIDPNDGAITGVWSETPVANVTGTNTSVWNAASGVAVNWRTNAIVHGRHLVGRTFFVPCASDVFDTNGNMVAASTASINANCAAFILAINPDFQIWHRGSASVLGSQGTVVSGSVVPKVVVLRKRRD
jgi:hypothetical protein